MPLNHKCARCWLKLHVLTQKSSDNALGGLGQNRGCAKTLLALSARLVVNDEP